MNEIYKKSLGLLVALTTKIVDLSKRPIDENNAPTVGYQFELAFYILDYLRQTSIEIHGGFVNIDDISLHVDEVFPLSRTIGKAQFKNFLDRLCEGTLVYFPTFGLEYFQETKLLESDLEGRAYRITESGMRLFSLGDTLEKLEYVPEFLGMMKKALQANDFTEFLRQGYGISRRIYDYRKKATHDLEKFRSASKERTFLVKQWQEYQNILAPIVKSDDGQARDIPSIRMLLNRKPLSDFPDDDGATRRNCNKMLDMLNNALCDFVNRINMMMESFTKYGSRPVCSTTLDKFITAFWEGKTKFLEKAADPTFLFNLGFWNKNKCFGFPTDEFLPLPAPKNKDESIHDNFHFEKPMDDFPDGRQLEYKRFLEIKQNIYDLLGSGPKTMSEILMADFIDRSSVQSIGDAISVIQARLGRQKTKVMITPQFGKRGEVLCSNSSDGVVFDELIFKLEGENENE